MRGTQMASQHKHFLILLPHNGLNDAWKCVSVELVNGCTPCIGGVTIVDCQVEPSQWFKVLVLESLCVDCSQRVISWAVKLSVNDEESITAPRTIAFDPTSPMSLQRPIASSPVSPGHYSLMAPHQLDAASCHDDLDHLFDLATKLFFVPPGHKHGDATWLRLLHCYLLPLVVLHNEDLPAIRAALNEQCQCIKTLDKQLVETSEQIEKLKMQIGALQEELTGSVESMAASGGCSVEFLKLFIADLKRNEESTRAKVQITMSQRALTSSDMYEQLDHQIRQDTTSLMKTLELRDLLVRALCTLDSNSDEQVVPTNHQGDAQAPPTETPPTQAPPTDPPSMSPDYGTHVTPTSSQATPTADPRVPMYVTIHKLMCEHKALSSKIVKDKVLALSLREALQLAAERVMEGNTSSGPDDTMGGSDPSDVYGGGPNITSETTSMRNQLREMVQSQTTLAGRLHCEFVDYLHREWFHTEGHASLCHVTSVKEPSLPSLFRSLSLSVKGGTPKQLKEKIAPPPAPPTQLPQLIKEHFQKMVDGVSQHLPGCDVNMKHRLWLCYERVFFETCGDYLLPLYQNQQSEICRKLKLTSLNVSLLDPVELGLSTRPEPWISLFQSRDFSVAMEMHASFNRQQCVRFKDVIAPPPESRFMRTFGSVVYDISCLQECISPLEKLQLLISALRKATSVLTDLRLKQMLNDDTCNLSSAVVSGDDLLPLLVLVLLQLHPSFLAHLHLQCCLLEDYMAPFLSLGWHGYSLVTFQSAIKAIADLHEM